MKKLIPIVLSAGLTWATEPTDLLSSEEEGNWKDKTSATLSGHTLKNSGGWNNGKAVYNFKTPLDLSLVGSSVTVTYTFNEIGTVNQQKNNFLATVTLFSAGVEESEGSALITGWGALSASPGIQAGVTSVESAKNCFRLVGKDSNGQYEQPSRYSSKKAAYPLEGITLSDPFAESKATVTVTLACTGESAWKLTMSCNGQEQSVTLNGEHLGSTIGGATETCDFSQINNLTVSFEGPNNNAIEFKTLTVAYTVPEPATGMMALLAVGGLCLRRKK